MHFIVIRLTTKKPTTDHSQLAHTTTT